MVHAKKHFDFGGLLRTMAGKIKQINDNRQQGKVDYSLHDCVMSAFAMMYLQDPSLLAYQRRIQDRIQRNNLNTIFQIRSIPKDSQLRNVMDTFPIETLSPRFADFLGNLQRGKHLSKYQLLDGKYLIPIDGSEYFSSEKIHCPHFLHKKPKKGNVRYYDQILQATIVHPEQRHVLPLAPEPTQNTDKSNKQDCELNATKRLITKIRTTHPKLPIIIGGDGLYSKQPFINELKTASMSLLLQLIFKLSEYFSLFWLSASILRPAG